MNAGEVLKHVDHTLLQQPATWDEIRQICDEANEYQTANNNKSKISRKTIQPNKKISTTNNNKSKISRKTIQPNWKDIRNTYDNKGKICVCHR